MDGLCSFVASLLVVITLAVLQGGHAVDYEVINSAATTPGGIRFDNEIGVAFTMDLLSHIDKFIWYVFQQPKWSDRRDMPKVRVYIADYIGRVAAYTNINLINVSAPFLQSLGADIKWQFSSLMYHELTHIFQWSGNYTAPGGLTEGIADYVRLKANFIHPETYTKPGEGNRWDEGYGVTARFLEYCDCLRGGFTTALNNRMRYAYSDDYFVELLGKPIDQLWSDYKAAYAK